MESLALNSPTFSAGSANGAGTGAVHSCPFTGFLGCHCRYHACPACPVRAGGSVGSLDLLDLLGIQALGRDASLGHPRARVVSAEDVRVLVLNRNCNRVIASVELNNVTSKRHPSQVFRFVLNRSV